MFIVLKSRFEKNIDRHQGLDWADARARLESHPEKLWSLNEMERTGGEPDVAGLDMETDGLIFYDHEALEARKANKRDGYGCCHAYRDFN